MRPATHPAALRVQQLLGSNLKVVEFDQSTKTAADAAAAVGCNIAQIAKSIMFKAAASGRAVLVIASGINRIDEKKIRSLLGEEIERADAEFVRERTGFAIGGVPPVGHVTPAVVFVDEDLKQYPTLWAAGGTPNAVYETGFNQLVALAGGTVADIAKRG